MTDSATRTEDLRQMLTERRLQMQDSIRKGIRRRNTDGPSEGRDDLEVSDANVQGDIEFALLQLSAETLSQIEKALARLEAGRYGSCADCGDAIAERRLRALPFAVRCQSCEEQREKERGRAHHRSQQHDGLSLFPHTAGV
jgi:DnaK suppressor protein